MYSTDEQNGPEHVGVISNTGEVDYLKVAGLRRIKTFLVLRHL